MSIDIYSTRISPPCRAVLMTAKQLNIDLNVKEVDLTEGQHFKEDYLKINPGHTIPTIIDNGFILWESRAIMQYLCNRYAPDNPLYPKDPKQRALVDRWLYSDLSFASSIKEVLAKPKILDRSPPEPTLNAFKASLKLLDQLIGDNKYLVGNHLTLADLSVLATTSSVVMSEFDLTEYSNFKTWYTGLQEELDYFDEINKFSEEEVNHFINKMKLFVVKLMQIQN